ncbi:ArsR/SmtB family transcription factor [Thermoactinomyces mirandus]|uniref:Winged helix-turn-helix transcriptional regulator n=1 Tax=Thermoactinomyces mirandus TaxID=2756294 RepID=A0A7W1XT16_9BACL|nr:metalloregulator ArsR/SmtB family transcription factor [Thermoactinomyces mirandus]MBA4602744.1 winged helix-turn-helix transcriptional regulator [Thermoactinomyces mirandus]
MKTDWIPKSDEEMEKIRQQTKKQFPMITNSELINISAFFKGLGDETRLKIIFLLWMEDLCMCEIVAALNGASSTISHHLKIMEKGGIIKSRREGRFTIYRVNKDKLAPIIAYLNKGSDEIPR